MVSNLAIQTAALGRAETDVLWPVTTQLNGRRTPGSADELVVQLQRAIVDRVRRKHRDAQSWLLRHTALMEPMPGEGASPVVEEFLSRMAPMPDASAQLRPADRGPQSLDEALACRRMAVEQQALVAAAYQRSRREHFERFWAVVKDFLARKPPPGHTVTRVQHHVEPGWLARRPRMRTETEPLGEGWWVATNAAVAPDNDHYPVSPWKHDVIFLLTTGDLITGQAFGL
jgi:hypothetical protein